MARHPCVFVDVDTQFDFMDPSGRLYVSGAEKLVPNLKRLFEAAAVYGIPVVTSADDHPVDDPEFAQFPPHCVRGTSGQANLPETLLPDRVVIGSSPCDVNMSTLLDEHPQVIFHKADIDLSSNPNAVRLFESADVDEYVVFGVATDYCVRADVLGLCRRGCKVRVVEDAVCGMAEDTTRRAWEEMTAAGATRTTTAQIVAECGVARAR